MVEIYRCKPIFENPETFLKLEPNGDEFSITHYFKAGATLKEVWSKKDLKEMKSQLTKVKEIKWKKYEEGEKECKKKLQLKKKTASKKKVTSKKKTSKK